MKTILSMVKACHALILALAVMPGLCFAQANLNARSFTDVDDTADSTADNTVVSTSNGLASIIQRLQCAAGLNPSGNTASVSLTAQMATYQLYNPSTNAFDTVNMRSYNGCPG